MLGRTEYYEPRKDFFVNCTRCGVCLTVCPTYNVTYWEHYSPRGRIVLSQLFELDEEVKKSVFTCLTCGYCENICNSGVKFTEEIEKVRRQFISSGYFVKKHMELYEVIKGYGNPYRGEPIIQEYRKVEIIYYPGCTALYKENELFEATKKLLDYLKVDYFVEAKHCCGSTALRVGLGEDVARKGFESIREAVEKTGASLIVTSCPGCYRTIRKDYRKMFGSVGAEIMHITEFLYENVHKFDFKRTNLEISYHDPCHLGRHMKIYEEPRALIEEVAKLKELERIKNESFCCGGGGGVRAGYKEFSMMVMEERIREVKRVNPDLLLSACPFCYRNLKRGDVAVKDITVLLSELVR